MRSLCSPHDPLSAMLGPAVQMRLHHALTVVYGNETYMVLKDNWGVSDRAVEKVALWMADALVNAALSEAKAPTPQASSPSSTRPQRKARNTP